MDVDLHNALHQVVSNIPLPPPQMLRAAWEAYQRDACVVDNYDFIKVCDWLIAQIDDLPFRRAISVQRNFYALNQHKYGHNNDNKGTLT